MALTGPADGEPCAAPARLAVAMDAIAVSIADATDGALIVDGPALLGEHAAHTGWRRQGPTSCGGQCRLLRAGDGWFALSLARPDDLVAVDAWLESAVGLGDDPSTVDWEALTAAVHGRPRADLVARANLLGLPVGALGEASPAGALVLATDRHVWSARPLGELVVVDLSSLWAGPLCANLLGLAGARVIKVESTRRPDGARFGPSGFFDLLHGGHESVAIDLTTEDGRAWLRRLVRAADVVIEASRPRALDAMGASFARCRAAGWSGAWVTITAHTDTGRVGFGDDAAAAGGLVVDGPSDPMFCADAVADPLTGAMAAATVLQAIRDGRGGRYSLALARSAALVAEGIARHGPVDGADVDAAAPRSRAVHELARPLGADTDAVLGAL